MLNSFEINKSDNTVSIKGSVAEDIHTELKDNIFFNGEPLTVAKLNGKVGEALFIHDPKQADEFKNTAINYFYCLCTYDRSAFNIIASHCTKIVIVCDDITDEIINTSCVFLQTRTPVFYYKKVNDANVDAIEYLAWLWSQEKEGEPRLKYIDKLTEIMSYVADKVHRQEYLKHVCKKFKLKVHDVQLNVTALINDRQSISKIVSDLDSMLPNHVDRDEFLRWGFYEDYDLGTAGYHFDRKDGNFDHISNFVIVPLFHVYSKNQTENKRLVEITNGLDKRILELPSKSFVSADQFKSFVFDEGNFLYAGSTPHLMKILKKIGGQFPLCNELKTLGWQHEGFFAFHNCIYRENIIEMDVYGIAEVEDKKYYSPAASTMMKDVRREDDEYINDKYLVYHHPIISFRDWAKMMINTYGLFKAAYGISYAVMSIFRDIIYKMDNTFPMLYPYGEPQSGKTAFADSISNLFFHGIKGFNLNQGTEFAFWSRMGRFRNCPVVFNEFDEDNIREEWFRGFKSAYDGEGRERGRGGSKNKTETQTIDCAIVLVGQILSTKDNGSVLSRSIPIQFDKVEDRSNEVAASFRELKNLEQKGLGGIIVELLSCRTKFENDYADKFDFNLKKLKESIKSDKADFKERIARNYCAMFTSYELMNQYLNLPVDINWFFSTIKNEVIRLSELINNSNALSDFWQTIVFLLDRGDLEYGTHYKIEVKHEVKIQTGRDKVESKQFQTPKKLLFIRLSSVHKMYLEAVRRQTGKAGLNFETLKIYMNAQKGFIGNNPGSNFKNDSGTNFSTSSFVFDYDLLGVDLERYEAGEKTQVTTIEGSVMETPKMVDNGYGPQIEFNLFKDDSYESDGQTVTKHTKTRVVLRGVPGTDKIIAGSDITVSGELAIKERPDTIYRTMYGTSFTIKSFIDYAKTNPELPI